MRFLHCADLHLDSPLHGLARYPGAPVDEVRGATRRALENLVACAKDQRVDFVVIAGDLYDGDWQDYNTGMFFAAKMIELGESRIPVCVLRGNHDAQSLITKKLRLPANVHTFASDAPHTLLLEEHGVALHGQSFPTREVMTDLAATYPRRKEDMFNIGVLHTALTGKPGHASYAPTNLDVLRGKGYDYWALGHVHAREIVSTDPWVVFPGNSQGRHIKETGAKGCELVTVADGKVQTAPIALDVLRWEPLSIDITDLEDAEALLVAVGEGTRDALARADDRLLALRLRLHGRGRAHREINTSESLPSEVQLRITEASGGRAWLEKIERDVRPPLDLDQLAKADDALGLLLRELAAIGEEPARRRALAVKALEDLQGKLPEAARMSLDPTDETVQNDLLRDAEGTLLAHLADEGDVA